jgi:gas vesicle protein
MIYNLNNKLNDNESEEEESYKVEINKKRINNIISKKLFSLRVNGNENSSNFTKDNENVKNINRGTLIKQFSNNIESTIDLLNEENNKNITIKISNLLQNLIFIEYNNNRKLSNFEKKINNLRYLQENNYFDTFSNNLHFYYPLFKSNLVGATVGLIADVEFMPMTGKFYIRMEFDANGKVYKILNKEKLTNFYNILTNINNILIEIYIALYEDSKTVQPIFDEFQSNITNSLTQFYNDIKILPQLKTEEFKYELERILLKVNETTASTYTEVYQNINNATKEYNTILTNIENGEESFVTSIKTNSSNIVEDFIEKNKDNLDKLFEVWTQFYNDVIPELEERKKDLTNNPNLTFEIGLYYNIKDEMNAIINVYKEFVKILENSFNIEDEKFTSEVNEN